jgi:cation diffusion facilitator CzcD-associated flavoprotein CzcO/aminoglycoside phosphotransferase (APT) family kinase protein
MNHHWRVRIQGRDLVLREYGWPFLPPAPARARREAMVLGLLEAAHVPAPRVLAVSDTALLATFERGQVLGEVLMTEAAPALDGAWHDVGRAWRRVHGIVPSGEVRARLLGGPQREVSGWYERVIEDVHRHLHAVEHKRPELEVDVARVSRLFVAAKELLEARPVRLLHGDAHLWNVLVDLEAGRWRCTAILDWECAEAGDPVWDLVGLHLLHRRDVGPHATGLLRRLRGPWPGHRVGPVRAAPPSVAGHRRRRLARSTAQPSGSHRVPARSPGPAPACWRCRSDRHARHDPRWTVLAASHHSGPEPLSGYALLDRSLEAVGVPPRSTAGLDETPHPEDEMAVVAGPTRPDGTPIDKDALARKYREERDKRLRAEGIGQYVRADGDLVQDPYTPVVAREPKRDHVTFTFIGGGFAGLVTGARLREAGVEDIRIIDKAGDFGGTWYWNRYPGAQCDTASFVYMPLLEETGHMPTEKYAHAPEILEHCQRIGKQFDLYEDALFHTQVTGLDWDDERACWVVRTDRGDEFTSQFVGMGTGPLHVAKLPGIPGIDEFRGHSFHTSRWDYDYTGGDPDGSPMEHLADKRVAIIGTGATAIQCIPHLARDAGELLVFQRTPSSVDVRDNAPTDPEWFASIATPGWQKHWLENFTANTMGVTGEGHEEDLVADGWTDIARRVKAKVLERVEATGEFDMDMVGDAFEDADFEKMEEIRARVDEVVEDPRTAEGLKAWYRQLCKRPCFHDEYLPAFNRSNVQLIHTDGQGVERITERGVVALGEEYEVDCIIYATGFEVGTAYTERAGYDVVGRLGLRLSELLGGRDAHHARHPCPRLPQRLPGAAHPGLEPHRERAPQPDRIGHDDRGDRPARAGQRAPHRRGHRAGGTGLAAVPALRRRGGRGRRAAASLPGAGLTRLHPGLLQQRGAAAGAPPALQLPRAPRGAAGLLPLHRAVARRRGLRGPGLRLSLATVPTSGRGRGGRRARSDVTVSGPAH